MIDKFKLFLAGSPYRMDEDRVEGWAYQVAVILPSVLRKWYDPDFGNDVWAKDGGYYETARLKLAGLAGFKKSCAEAGEALQGLRYLSEFFAEEKRKAGLGKTARKPQKAVGGGTPTLPCVGGGRGATALPTAGGGVQMGRAVAPRPPQVEVLTEGEIVDMHVAKHERNPALRKACIEHFRAQNNGRIVCEACGMSFGEMYGEFGAGYIEVHHLSPISQIEGVHQVDPKTDLVPLCANCHAMIHRLMAAETKSSGVNLEGPAALTGLRNKIQEHQQHA